MTLVDARGVEIGPGDAVIYGFVVGRSVAMAEGEVVPEAGPGPDDGHVVSLTPSGRVRVRIVRRSYFSGTKPVVDIMPDRLVVLKPCTELFTAGGDAVAVLPPSPLPTQAEANRQELEHQIAAYTEGLLAKDPPGWWPGDETLADYHDWCAKNLAIFRGQLDES